jgi:hypothetical protein
MTIAGTIIQLKSIKTLSFGERSQSVLAPTMYLEEKDRDDKYCESVFNFSGSEINAGKFSTSAEEKNEHWVLRTDLFLQPVEPGCRHSKNRDNDLRHIAVVASYDCYYNNESRENIWELN